MRRRKPKYVHEYVDCRKRARIYLRRPGEKRVALPGPLYSDAFWSAYHAAMKKQPMPRAIGAERTKAGSVSAVIVGYFGRA